MNCDDIQKRVHGYVDGELDPMESLEIEKHLGGCPDCGPVYEREQALHALMVAHANYHVAPEHLGDRVRAALRTTVGTHARASTSTWRRLSMGTALAFAVVATWGLTSLLSPPREQHEILRGVIADHVRSLMANHLTDVASSDEHTVKPWFNGKLDFSPPVNDLTRKGFSLVGGRLDYLDNRTVAALVYRHRKHPINLFIWPASGAVVTGMQTYMREGYNVVRWTQGEMNFWAISDLNLSELQRFSGMIQRPQPGPSRPKRVPGS